MDATPATPPASGPAGEPRSVDAGRGVAWWSEAWALFMRSAVLWIVLALILLVGMILVGWVPVIGALAISLLMPVFAGSWMLAARKVQAGGTLVVGDLFACFSGDKVTPLIVLGALLLVVMLVLGMVAGVLGFGAIFGMGAAGMHRSAGGVMAAMGAGMLAMLVFFVIGVVVSMALWFAPALVVFRGLQPMDAMRTSIGAVLKNVAPFLIWGLIYIVAAIAASIPFGLGWVVLVPVSLLAAYVSYQDVFEA